MKIMEKIQRGLHVYMSAPLQNLLINSNDNQISVIADMMDETASALIKLSAIKRVKAVKKIYSTIEKDFLKNHANEITCKKGCNRCCFQNVDIFDSEAKNIVSKHRDKIDRAYIEKQKDLDKDDYGRKEPSKCMFLNKNICSIYEDRPLACRKYFVKSPAEDCDLYKNFGKKVLVVSSNHMEMLDCAIGNIEDYDSMPKKLWKYL